jgi:hypothetical protein
LSPIDFETSGIFTSSGLTTGGCDENERLEDDEGFLSDEQPSMIRDAANRARESRFMGIPA